MKKKFANISILLFFVVLGTSGWQTPQTCHADSPFIKNAWKGLVFLADLKSVVGLFTDDGKTANVPAINYQLDRIATISGDNREHILWLKDQVDEKITREEFYLYVDSVVAKLAKLQQLASKNELEIEKNKKQIYSNSSRIEANKVFLAYLASKQEQMRRAFRNSINELEIEINEVKIGLKNEEFERKKADAKLKSNIDSNAGRISKLEDLITPKTRHQTASTLGAQGAIILRENGDAFEASRFLRLSIAYDKLGNRHVDPAARYWLAIAYRRLGKLERAEEMLAEAIAAERFRGLPKWHRIIVELFQGSDRFWIESARMNPRFGVKAPRKVATLEFSK